jgi:hypothetical protein
MLSEQASTSSLRFQKTKAALLWSSLLNEPLLTLYALLTFILCKDLGASVFQISVLMALKPIVSIFSFYWSASLGERKDKLRWNLVAAGILGRLPFLLFPFIDNVWFIVAGAIIYMFFYRAGNPAWMEILKLNLPKASREKLFSLSSAIGYGEGVLLAIGFGALMDHGHGLWRILFFGSALLGIGTTLLQLRVPIDAENQLAEKAAAPKKKNHLLDPWKTCIRLMKTRPDFAQFQWGFMACGFGIMLIQPALPFFFVDILRLSYIDLAIALSICKGLGFVFSSSLWAKAMQRFSIAKLACAVFVCTGFFPLFLLMTPLSLFWLYLAYFLYGIAQGGSHLIWHLCGPIFSDKEDSSQFSGVNVMMVGVRGAAAHPLGGFLSGVIGPLGVLGLGVVFCFYGGWKMLSKQFVKQPVLLSKE